MAKSKLLQIVALTATITLVGCSSTGDQETGAEVISTEERSETVDPAVEVVETTDAVVTDTVEPTDDSAYVEPAIDRPLVNVVYFEFDKAAITAEFRALLDQHGDYLATNPEASLILEGHADERGTREYNLALGERRAFSVSSYLKLRGVSSDQFELVSFGEEKPVAMGSTKEAYSLNRRVEFKYQ